jgi:hypothetical protein
MGWADVTAVKNQRVFPALRALPHGTGRPCSLKRVPNCEVHYSSPRPQLHSFPTRAQRWIAQTRRISEHSRVARKMRTS